MKKIVGMNILNIGRGYFVNIVVKLLPVLTDGYTMYHNKSVCVYICKLENYSVHILCKKSVLPTR